jgi:hypothetical protein
VADKPEIQKLVKSFEDGFNEKMRKAQMERAVQQQAKTAENSGDRYLGAELCIRCHAGEGEQWKTTAHSAAWETLVAGKKDADPECITCHVLGFNQPGGYANPATTPQLVNVQCENCHGMGTQHDAYSSAAFRITEQTCKKCHTPDRDPHFDFGKKLPMIAHGNTSGETLAAHKKRLQEGGSAMMGGKGGLH